MTTAQQIAETFDRCEQRFPTVRLPIEVSQTRVGEILASAPRPDGDEALLKAFAGMHPEALFLAACLRS